MKSIALAAFAALLLADCGGGASAAPLIMAPVSGPQPPVIAAIGDSVTAGYTNGGDIAHVGVNYVQDATKAYSARVAASIGATSVTNLGIPGATNATILSEVTSIPLNATVVIVNAGTNDCFAVTGYFTGTSTETTATAIASYDALIAAVRVRVPGARIVVLDIRDFARVFPSPTGIEAFIDAYDTHVMATPNATAIDVANRSGADSLTNFPDDVHPSLAGVQWIADAITSVL